MRKFLPFLFLIVFAASTFAQQATGAPAQDFSVTTIDGKTYELSALKGKVVVMTFWSTRCEICRSEIPSLNKLVDKYEGKVVFLGLAWQDKAKLDVFLKERPFRFEIVPQSFGVLLKYAARDEKGRLNMGYPSHFVIDGEGVVVFQGEGFSKTKKLDGLLADLTVQTTSDTTGN
ncbi:MAG: TlpA disulfide reductase family protein [Pyrinomonadaceae bacterium]